MHSKCHVQSHQSRADAQDSGVPGDAYLSLAYQNQSGEIYRRAGGRITRDKVAIEREEPLKRQLTSFIECASTGREPRVSGFQATAALELAAKITKRSASSVYFRSWRDCRAMR